MGANSPGREPKYQFGANTSGPVRTVCKSPSSQRRLTFPSPYPYIHHGHQLVPLLRPTHCTLYAHRSPAYADQSPQEMTYCSRECRARDNLEDVDLDDDSCVEIIPVLPVSQVDQEPAQYTGTDIDGILAWAAQIPHSAAPYSAPPIEECDASLSASSWSPSASSSSLRPPKLLLPHRKALPPSLCMSTPKPTIPQPSIPIHARRQSISDLVRDHPTILSRESMTSLVTDSVATPTSGLAEQAIPGSFFSHLATHVRSWVAPSSHPKASQHAVQPAIAGVDDTFHFASKSRAYLPDDELAHFAAPVAKFKWDLAVEHDIDFSDEEDEYEYDDESLSCSPKLQLNSSVDKTPMPHKYTYPTESESSSSILDILVEEFHPAFQARGRSMVRCTS